MTYTPPIPADLRMRYPAFSDTAAVTDATIQYWLTDAARFADDSWPIVTDIAPAQIAVAAHNMMTAGVAGVSDSDIASLLASGVADFQSGGREGFRVSLAPAAIQQALNGGYENTRPGQEYLRLLARNKGGGGVTAAGVVPYYNNGFNGFAGPMGYPAARFPC